MAPPFAWVGPFAPFAEGLTIVTKFVKDDMPIDICEAERCNLDECAAQANGWSTSPLAIAGVLLLEVTPTLLVVSLLGQLVRSNPSGDAKAQRELVLAAADSDMHAQLADFE